MGSMNETGNNCISLAMHLASLTAFIRVRLYLIFTFDLFHFTFYSCCFGIFAVSEFVPINKGNNKITELRTILQRESQNS